MRKFFTWIKSIDALLIILTAIAFNRVTDWLPSHYYIHPFPFYEITDSAGNPIGITLQSYFFFICGHVIFILYWNYCMKESLNEKPLFWCFRGIEMLSLIDFLLIYEKPFAQIGDYGLEFTDIKIISYASLYILWRTGK